MESRLVEIFYENPDHGAMIFCAEVLSKEDILKRPHLTHLWLMNGFVWGTNGHTTRRAKVSGDYEDGLYRVFRKDKKGSVIIYMADHDAVSSYPNTDTMFLHDGDPISQISVTEAYWYAHAEIVQALSAKTTFDASLLKGTQGVYDLYCNGAIIILDNEEFSIAIAPLVTQQSLPGM